MLSRTVQQTIERHAMVDRGQPLLVGVSGGADSVCLLLILKELGYAVAAAHLNHGLRGDESDGDETFVRQLCQRLDIALRVKRVELAAGRGNLEAAGRDERRRFFDVILAEGDFAAVALAHSRDDRVETFLLNLLRGSGAEGLASMEPVAGRIVRPLIEASRPAIESYLAEHSQRWRTDSSNRDPRFARNRLRATVIPELAAGFNPRLAETLTRTIRILHDENDWLHALTGHWLAEHANRNATACVLDANALAPAAVALQRRVLRAALQHAGGLQDVGFEHIEAALALLAPGRSGKWVEIPGGLTVTRSFGQLIVQGRREQAAGFEYRLQIPGEIHIPEVDRVFSARLVTQPEAGGSADRVIVDGGNIGPYVRIRNWKPGDYYKPVGLPGGKLKKLFQRARIPRSQRLRWPVLVADSAIVWVASFPVSREFAPRGCSQRMVAFEALPTAGAGREAR